MSEPTAGALSDDEFMDQSGALADSVLEVLASKSLDLALAAICRVISDVMGQASGGDLQATIATLQIIVDRAEDGELGNLSCQCDTCLSKYSNKH